MLEGQSTSHPQIRRGVKAEGNGQQMAYQEAEVFDNWAPTTSKQIQFTLNFVW
jgi:hypothetical protein